MSRVAAKLFIDGEARDTGAVLEVPARWGAGVASRCALGGVEEIDRAIAAAELAHGLGPAPLHDRTTLLRRASAEIDRRAEDFARVILAESGKTISDARTEVSRAVETLRVCAEEAPRALSEAALPLDSSARGGLHRAQARRVACGAVSLITPFNFPLNLVAHKVGPAIAAGCPWVLKPSEKTPATALMLGEVLVACAAGRGWSIVPALPADAGALITDDRPAALSFTGSAEVGWRLRALAGRKKVVLELGGNAFAVVMRDADLELAAERIVFGAFANSGQSCISVQHALVEHGVYEGVRDRIVARVASLHAGDPNDERTNVGPMIDEPAAVRLEAWIHDALERGARALIRGERRGNLMTPWVLEDVPWDSTLARCEAFGPVVCLSAFAGFEDAAARVNASAFGLQCGVFTRDLDTAHRAWDVLRVGAVVINDAPTFRVEAMPYGGVKASGLGREGPFDAIREFTEPRLMIVRGAGRA